MRKRTCYSINNSWLTAIADFIDSSNLRFNVLEPIYFFSESGILIMISATLVFEDFECRKADFYQKHDPWYSSFEELKRVIAMNKSFLINFLIKLLLIRGENSPTQRTQIDQLCSQRQNLKRETFKHCHSKTFFGGFTKERTNNNPTVRRDQERILWWFSLLSLDR